MPHKADWTRILVECSNKVRQKIKPFMETLNQPQPNLGIGAGGDPIKKIDLIAEKAIVETMRKNEITFTLISEESGIAEYGSHPCECYVIVDPIDGTTNLMRGAPFYATSIAVSTEPTLNKIHVALVADLFHNVTYAAQKACGAWRNNRKTAPSKNVSLEDSVIGLDLNSYRIKALAPKLTGILSVTRHVRHFGANALELCYVADGTLDAFVDIRGKLRTTDMAAAWLVINESGAIIATPEGKPLNAKLDPKHTVKFLAAANDRIRDRIIGLLNPTKVRE